MSDPFDVPSSERGVVRVFTTDLDAEGNSAITVEKVHRLLGNDLELDPKWVEVFPSTVLDQMGLSAYLEEGYGIPPEDLTGTSAALDAMKGLVILVASGAFKGQSVTLDPKQGIRFVGTFREPASVPPSKMAVSEAAQGNLSPDGTPVPLDSRAGSSWPLVLLALLVAAGLVLFLAI